MFHYFINKRFFYIFHFYKIFLTHLIKHSLNLSKFFLLDLENSLSFTSWAEKETFSFCFDGIPEASIVAVSTVGIKRDDDAFQVWKDGMDAMIDKIKPKTILIYGGKLEYDYPEETKTIYFENKVTERMKKGK
ncbi:DUF4417 domain-containing protein [Bulleidia extructa]|uniref:DUF4417 domain-containing protein n=1 Tax=Bulleidia extructa TaxID=118748 RepID=UPI003BEF51C2